MLEHNRIYFKEFTDMSTRTPFRLLIACPDRPGIIAHVSSTLAHHGANITAFDQHSEGGDQGMFFMRAEFDLPDAEYDFLRQALEALAPAYQMQWRLTPTAYRPRLAIWVSRESHCLTELIGQVESGDIAADIAVILGNHDDLKPIADRHDIPFYTVPVDARNKAASEATAEELMSRYAIDTIVLARYMQILTPEFVARYPQRIINIHHSFLPAFIGPRPYHQAYARGVKLIGATAHYVTADLDAGPIIEQDVHRVDHRYGLEDFKRIGRYVERMVLARAVAWHVEDRVLVYQNRTVVFPW